MKQSRLCGFFYSISKLFSRETAIRFTHLSNNFSLKEGFWLFHFDLMNAVRKFLYKKQTRKENNLSRSFEKKISFELKWRFVLGTKTWIRKMTKHSGLLFPWIQIQLTFLFRFASEIAAKAKKKKKYMKEFTSHDGMANKCMSSNFTGLSQYEKRLVLFYTS